MHLVIRRFLIALAAVFAIGVGVYVAELSGVLTWLDAKSGFQKGDVVISMNGEVVSSLHRFKKAIREADRRAPLHVQVKRGSEMLSLVR
jgi:hypothetical protein